MVGGGRTGSRRMGSRMVAEGGRREIQNLAEVLKGDRHTETGHMARPMGEDRAVVHRKGDGRMEEGLRIGDGRGRTEHVRREAVRKAAFRTAAGRSRNMKPLYS